MIIKILSFIFLVFISSWSYALDTENKGLILGKECLVEDYSTYKNIKLPLGFEKIYNIVPYLVFDNDLGEKKAIINKKEYVFDDLNGYSFKSSEDGKNYYFIAKKDNGKYVFVNNGNESNQYNSILDKYNSEDFKNIMFTAINENKNTIAVINGKEGKEYKSITKSYIVNDQYIYIAQKENGKFVVINKGEESKEYNKIDYLSISKNQDSYSFIGIDLDLNFLIVKDGIEINKYNRQEYDRVFGLRYFNNDITYFISNSKVTYSIFMKSGNSTKIGEYKNINIETGHAYKVNKNKDRTTLTSYNNDMDVYVGTKLNGNKVIINNELNEFEGYDNFINNNIYIDSVDRFFYTIKEVNDIYILIDGKKFGPYKTISLIEHSLISNKYVFKAKKNNGKEVVIYDGIEGKEYDYIYASEFLDDSFGEFSNDGNNYSYVALKKINGEEFTVIITNNDETGLEYKKYTSETNISDLVYSTDGIIFAYIVKDRDGYYAVQNGKKSEIYEEIHIVTYNKQSKSFGLFAKKIGGDWTYVDNFQEKGYFKNYYGTVLSNQKDKFAFLEGNNIVKDGVLLVNPNNNGIYENYQYSKNSEGFIYSYIDKNGKSIINLDGKESIGFDELQLIGFVENDEYFSFFADKKLFKCPYIEKVESVKGELISKKINNGVQSNGFNYVILYFIVGLSLFLGIIFYFVKRKKLNSK